MRAWLLTAMFGALFFATGAAAFFHEPLDAPLWCTNSTFCSLGYWNSMEMCHYSSGDTTVDVTRIKYCGSGTSCGSWKYHCSDSKLKKTRTCTTRGCDNATGCTMTSTPTTVTVTDCGSGTTCTDWSYYCSGDQVRRTRNCTTLGCSDAACISDSVTEDEAVESCGGSTSCTEWQQVCSDDDVVQQRTCTVRGCVEGACGETQTVEELPLESCEIEGGCTEWSDYCVGDDVWRTRTCTEGGCSGGTCQDSEASQNEFVASCSTPTTCGEWEFFCSGSEQWERRTCSTGACVEGACGTLDNDEERFVQGCVYGCSDGYCRPNPVINAAPTEGQAVLNVNFDSSDSEPSVAGASITEVTWDFGDGRSSSEASVVHSFTTGGTHNVILSVHDSAGGFAQSSIQIEVEGTPRILSLEALDVSVAGEDTTVNLTTSSPDVLIELSVFRVEGGGNNVPVEGLTGIQVNSDAFPAELGPLTERGLYMLTAEIVGDDCPTCKQEAFFTVGATGEVAGIPDMPPAFLLLVLAGVLFLLNRKRIYKPRQRL